MLFLHYDIMKFTKIRSEMITFPPEVLINVNHSVSRLLNHIGMSISRDVGTVGLYQFAESRLWRRQQGA